ncbi:MAG TPA: hypothetical protein VFQ32_05395 [Ktedonobacterales bacterium]|nr:hypothetical protein [Ktedonobacterales bacterium]
MLELVLEIEIGDAADEGAIRGLVGRRAGVELIGPDEPRLDERADVDTLLMEVGGASERYHGLPPHALGWVVVDEAERIRVLLEETTITAIDAAQALSKMTASWIATLAQGSYFEGDFRRLASGADSETMRDAERGENYIFDNHLDWYPEFLNAFEVMERHNVSGAPPIHRVGIEARGLWIPGLLRAYQTYRERKLAGAYEPPNHSDS